MERKEDLLATGQIETTLADIDMYADDWVEQAALKAGAVEGNTYVKLNRGVLTVDQINALLDSMPLEFSYIDANNQFIFYNDAKPSKMMLAPSKPESVGKPLGTLHPEQITQMVQKIVGQLRNDERDIFTIGHPAAGGEQFITHNYKRIEDREGNYLGINEYVQDLKPLVDYYLKQTEQKLVPDAEAKKPQMPPIKMDAVSGASKSKETDVDALTHATSKH